MCKTQQLASMIWSHMQNNPLLTRSTTEDNRYIGLQSELTFTESVYEDYPITHGFLLLFDSLISTLGRTILENQEFKKYFYYIIDEIYSKIEYRKYKDDDNKYLLYIDLFQIFIDMMDLKLIENDGNNEALLYFYSKIFKDNNLTKILMNFLSTPSKFVYERRVSKIHDQFKFNPTMLEDSLIKGLEFVEYILLKEKEVIKFINTHNNVLLTSFGNITLLYPNFIYNLFLSVDYPYNNAYINNSLKLATILTSKVDSKAISTILLSFNNIYNTMIYKYTRFLNQINLLSYTEIVHCNYEIPSISDVLLSLFHLLISCVDNTNINFTLGLLSLHENQNNYQFKEMFYQILNTVGYQITYKQHFVLYFRLISTILLNNNTKVIYSLFSDMLSNQVLITSYKRTMLYKEELSFPFFYLHMSYILKSFSIILLKDPKDPNFSNHFDLILSQIFNGNNSNSLYYLLDSFMIQQLPLIFTQNPDFLELVSNKECMDLDIIEGTNFKIFNSIKLFHILKQMDCDRNELFQQCEDYNYFVYDSVSQYIYMNSICDVLQIIFTNEKIYNQFLNNNNRLSIKQFFFSYLILFLDILKKQENFDLNIIKVLISTFYNIMEHFLTSDIIKIYSIFECQSLYISIINSFFQLIPLEKSKSELSNYDYHYTYYSIFLSFFIHIPEINYDSILKSVNNTE